MNKLRTAAIATSVFVAGAFGAFEADKSLNQSLTREKVACYAHDVVKTQACVSTIDIANESEYLAIEVLEAGLILGGIGCGLEFVRELRKQSGSSIEDIFSNK